MTDDFRFETRMSDSDALMWRIETDPVLRSTITSVAVYDRAVERARITDRVDRATRLVPRLRQRVLGAPFSPAPPRWVVDEHFDGIPVPVWFAGAKLEAQFPFGPLAGSPTNITLLSYVDECQIGVNTDPAAIPDPDVFVACLTDAFDELRKLA